MSPAAARRARALIAAHGGTWLGLLASVAVASKTIFTRGFPSTVGVNARTEAMLETVVGAPEWFSVEELGFSGAMADRHACAAIVTHPVMRSLRVVRGLGTRPASIIAEATPPLPLVTLGISDIASDVTDELATCRGLPHLQRIDVVHSSWVRGLEDLVAFATAPVARRIRAVALTIGVTTFELELAARGQRRLRLVVRPFDRKERVAQFTDVDKSNRADLAGLATFPNLVGVEVVVPAPLPAGFDAWLAQLLEELPDLPRRITHPG